MRKWTVLVLCLVMVLILAGCGETVSEIAGNVANAAMAELEAQVKAALEEHKVDVVEIKTAAGKLNDDEGELQFYCAALVQSDSVTVPQACADALGVVFHDAGVVSQSGSTVESEHLLHKDITFKHTDFSEGNYYVIYAYMGKITLELPTTEGK